MRTIKIITLVFPFLILSGAQEISGCMDPVALNFDPAATLDDYSCTYDVDQWGVTPSDYLYDGAIVAAVFVNSIRTANTADILAVFAPTDNGMDCRGLANGLMIPNSQDMVFMVMLYSNASSGETLELRYYNSATGIVTTPEMTLEFSPNMILGTVLTPLEIDVSELSFDCAGDYGGTAYFDDCGMCSEGNSGHPANSDMDFCGVCFGGDACAGDGDLNGDGSLDILDAVRLVSVIMGEIEGSAYEVWAGDANGDGALDVLDVIVIMTIIMANLSL